MNPSKNFCIYRSIVKAAMQRAEKHQWQSGMVKFFLDVKKKNHIYILLMQVIVPFLSIFLRDVYFIKVRSPDVITNADGQEELNLKVEFICVNMK